MWHDSSGRICFSGPQFGRRYYITQPTLPLDVLEHLAWGREWRWVYAHHPGLPAWINEAVYSVLGEVALSATAPLATTLAMAAVWVLARRMVGDQQAAVAALSLEGVYYFNVAAVEFNHNVVQLAACAWLVAATHKAFLQRTEAAAKILPWVLLAVAAAVSMYAKYSSLLFLAVLLVWSIAEVKARRQWKTPGPAIAVAVFIALNLPQLSALIELQFAPLQFAVSRAATAKAWSDHMIYPLRFLAAQTAAVMLALALCWRALNGPGKLAAVTAVKAGGNAPSPCQRRFVFVAAFAPLLLALLISAVFGLRFKSMWGAAMLTFIPLFIVVLSPPPVRWRQWQIALAATAAFALFAATAINVGAPFFTKRGKRVHYPAAAIAAKVDLEWQRRHPDFPLRYVIGKKHIASLISFYSPARPAAVIDANWQNLEAKQDDFARSGGVIAWIVNDGNRSRNRLPEFATAFATAENTAIFSFFWETAAELPPLEAKFVFVAPARGEER